MNTLIIRQQSYELMRITDHNFVYVTVTLAVSLITVEQIDPCR